ncbi:MAG TPA: hypothetical protein VNE61_10840 [Ktedonobacteraceae bacterium]|nr:hypothetical protein [Ktedonobacteraceae bacterium]
MSGNESIDDEQEHAAPENDDDDELTETDEFDYPPPPPKRRRRPLAIFAVIVLIILLVGGGLAISRAVNGGAFGPAPTPTTALLPGENLFYVTTDPSWGAVSVDGHILAHPPALGSQPLTLSAGGHTIVWNAPPLPPQKCLIFVPPQQTSGGNCSVTNQMTVQNGKDAGLQATVVEFTLTSSMLSSAQFTALSNTIQTYFNTFQSADTVQPGEQYADANAPNDVATATQPLKATFKVQLDNNPRSNRPCYGAYIGGAQSCSSCYTFCSPSFGLDFNALPKNFSYPPTWDIYAVAYATWDYTTLSGQSVAANQPDTATSTGIEYVTALYISWTGSQWHVSATPAKNDTSFFFGFTPPCSVIQATMLNNNSLSNQFFSVTINGQPQNLSWQDYDSGHNLAQGCLAGAIIQPGNNTPVATNAPEAYVLYRFGVLLAANSLAHRWWPNLPVANSYEQGIVQQLLPKHR